MIWPAFCRSENATPLDIYQPLMKSVSCSVTYWTPVVLPLVLASLGELMPSALLNLGTAGVSKAAFLFIAPFVERWGTGAFGTMPSSLFFSKQGHFAGLGQTYMPNTSSPLAVLLGVAYAPRLSTLRTCALPRDSRSNISCRSFLKALAVGRSSLVCSDPIFKV